MSSTRLGTEISYIHYQNSFTSEEYNKRQNKIEKEGLYQGGDLSNSGTVLTLAPYVASYRTSAGQQVRVETTTNITSDSSLPVSESNPIVLTEPKPYVVGNYSWINSATNYVDYAAKDLGEIYDNDIIFGKALFTSGVVTSFSYAEKTYGLKDTNDNVYVNSLIVRTDNTVGSGTVESGLVITSQVEGGTNLVGYLNGQKINIAFTTV